MMQNSNEPIKDEPGTTSTSADAPLVFTTTDPLNRTVQFKQGTWDYHVVNGHNQRPEFIGQEQEVKGLISDPEFIVPDPEYTTRERYYGLVYFSTLNKIKPLMVVVDHATSTGDVCSMFVQSTLKETGERGIVYARKKN